MLSAAKHLLNKIFPSFLRLHVSLLLSRSSAVAKHLNMTIRRYYSRQAKTSLKSSSKNEALLNLILILNLS